MTDQQMALRGEPSEWLPEGIRVSGEYLIASGAVWAADESRLFVTVYGTGIYELGDPGSPMRPVRSAGPGLWGQAIAGPGTDDVIVFSWNEMWWLTRSGEGWQVVDRLPLGVRFRWVNRVVANRIAGICPDAAGPLLAVVECGPGGRFSAPQTRTLKPSAEGFRATDTVGWWTPGRELLATTWGEHGAEHVVVDIESGESRPVPLLDPAGRALRYWGTCAAGVLAALEVECAVEWQASEAGLVRRATPNMASLTLQGEVAAYSLPGLERLGALSLPGICLRAPGALSPSGRRYACIDDDFGIHVGESAKWDVRSDGSSPRLACAQHRQEPAAPRRTCSASG